MDITSIPDANSLSLQQRAILLHLFRIHKRHHQGVWGVPWGTSTSRTEAASLSRSLRRLEERGLILRQNIYSGNNATPHTAPDGRFVLGRVRGVGDQRLAKSRTTSVTILPAGIELAERLTRQATEDVNRPTRRAA